MTNIKCPVDFSKLTDEQRQLIDILAHVAGMAGNSFLGKMDPPFNVFMHFRPETPIATFYFEEITNGCQCGCGQEYDQHASAARLQRKGAAITTSW